jgi:hypothetical protein
MTEDEKYEGLTKIGYWYSPFEVHLPMPVEDSSTLSDTDREALAAYLDAGKLHTGWRGPSPCRLCDENWNGSTCLTDGTYVWPEGLAHYVRDHRVALPEDFERAALGRTDTSPDAVEVVGESVRCFHLASEFSEWPAGRYGDDGPASGEAFRAILHEMLEGHDVVRLDMRGIMGFGSSFLEECFGGLVRECGHGEELFGKLELICDLVSTKVRTFQFIQEQLQRDDRETDATRKARTVSARVMQISEFARKSADRSRPHALDIDWSPTSWEVTVSGSNGDFIGALPKTMGWGVASPLAQDGDGDWSIGLDLSEREATR